MYYLLDTPKAGEPDQSVTAYMTDELQLAIDNSIGFYRTVLGAQGIDVRVQDGFAYTCERAPTYYSNTVTRSKSWSPDEVFQDIGLPPETGAICNVSGADEEDACRRSDTALRRS